MTDEEFPAFEVLMHKLRFVFRLRASTEEFVTLCEAYFKALRRFSVPELQAGADHYVTHGKGFPRPAEWRADVPRPKLVRAQWPVATEQEAHTYRDAARLGYEDSPCLCKACALARVSDLPRRFVPDLLADGQERRLQDPHTGRSFVMGHWAHGEELALWHLARERFRDDLMAWLPNLQRQPAALAVVVREVARL